MKPNKRPRDVLFHFICRFVYVFEGGYWQDFNFPFFLWITTIWSEGERFLPFLRLVNPRKRKWRGAWKGKEVEFWSSIPHFSAKITENKLIRFPFKYFITHFSTFDALFQRFEREGKREGDVSDEERKLVLKQTQEFNRWKWLERSWIQEGNHFIRQQQGHVFPLSLFRS